MKKRTSIYLRFLPLVSMLMLCVNSVLFAAAPNTSCETAKAVGQDFQETITEPGEYWYYAFTYDLPMTIHYTPTDKKTRYNMGVEVDFACDQNYEKISHKLDSIIKVASDFKGKLPYKLNFDIKFDETTQEYTYDLTVPRKYRDQLAAAGYTDNVRAVVKVKVECPGTVEMVPDETTVECMKLPRITLSETPIHINANDEKTAYIMPFAEWRNDSVKISWNGTSADLSIWFGGDRCDFEPKKNGAYVIREDVGYPITIPAGGAKKFSTDEISSFINIMGCGGVYYAKFVSAGSGELVVERAPMKDISDIATQLVYNKPYAIEPSDQTLYYYVKKYWGATRIEAETASPVTLYVGSSDALDKSDASTHVAALPFDWDSQKGVRYLELSGSEITTFGKSNKEDYVYFRFETESATHITATKWEPSDCEDKSTVIRSGVPVEVAAGDNGKNAFRLRMSEWSNGDIEVVRSKGNQDLEIFLSDVCNPTTIKAANAKIHNRYLKLTKAGTGKWTSATIQDWMKKEWKDENDNIYVLFKSKTGDASTVTFTLKEASIETINVLSVSGGTVIDQQHQSLQFSAEILPSAAAGKPVKWTIQDPFRLVNWDEASHTISGKQGLGAGTVTIVVEALDGSGVKGTLEVEVKSIPIPVSSIDLTIDHTNLTLANPTAKLTITVQPTNATYKRTTFVAVSGSELIRYNAADSTLSLRANPIGGEARFAFIAADGSNVSSDTLTVTVESAPQTISSITLSGPTKLGPNAPTGKYSVVVLPEDAEHKDVDWLILEGEDLVTWNEADSTLNIIKNTHGGKVVFAAVAADGSNVGDTLTIQVASSAILVNEIVVLATPTTLTPEEPTAQLTVGVSPFDALNKEYELLIISGASFVTLDAENETVTMVEGTTGGQVTIAARAKDEGRVSGIVTITVINTLPVNTITIHGPETLNRKMQTGDYTATVLPEKAANRELAWDITKGIELVDTTYTTAGIRLTAKRNTNGGEVVLTAQATDGTQTTATKTITIEAIPVLAEQLILSTEEGTTVLSQSTPVLHLTAEVLPEDTKRKDVIWSIVGESQQVVLSDNVLTQRTGFMNETVIVRATVQDESKRMADMEISVIGISEALQAIHLDTYEHLYVLDDEHQQLHLQVSYTPLNPHSRDIQLEIINGKNRVEPITDYEPGMGYILARANGATSGDVLVRATSVADNQLQDEINILVMGNPEQDIRQTEKTKTYHKILRQGILYMVTETDGETIEYNTLGNRVK